jgi:aryl-alcohol dehydrogenase-like predicted oxidoreductase
MRLKFIVGEALAPFRKDVKIATKFGFNIENGKQAGLDSRGARCYDGTPEMVAPAARAR